MLATATGSPIALQGLGEPIPNTAHAVSVSLPSWRSNIAYEEGEDWVVSKMQNGYPRFFIHLSIVAFQESLLNNLGRRAEQVLLFPSTEIAQRCAEFISRLSENWGRADYLTCRVIELVPVALKLDSALNNFSEAVISAVLFDTRDNGVARKFWQHTGDGVSSRRAEFFHRAYKEGRLVSKEIDRPSSSGIASPSKGPRRYRREDRNVDYRSKTGITATQGPGNTSWEDNDYSRFTEERFGRNLDLSMASKAKLAIRRRIAGSLSSDADPEAAITVPRENGPGRNIADFTEDHVFLYPCGMSAIYNTHRMIMSLRGPMKSVMFGFPYTDTLKVLEKFGPGAIFYGEGSNANLDCLERRCESGERLLALFCEFPGNPLLKTPDLHRIRTLADKYDFMVVVDETIGNFLNVNVLPAADIVVSSLTKVFSGDSNVMGGSMVVNPNGKYYEGFIETIQAQYTDHLWLEDAIFLERNSRDFVRRNERINSSAETLAKLLQRSPKVKDVNYPKFNNTRANFDEWRNSDGGYSGLLSATFFSGEDAITFYDTLATAKGPSLGTNFTLSSPFVILAHYYELDWVKEFGVEPELVRISVGLEPIEHLTQVFQKALDAI